MFYFGEQVNWGYAPPGLQAPIAEFPYLICHSLVHVVHSELLEIVGGGGEEKHTHQFVFFHTNTKGGVQLCDVAGFAVKQLLSATLSSGLLKRVQVTCLVCVPQALHVVQAPVCHIYETHSLL